MYSVVLLMSMQAAPTEPAGLFYHRRQSAGCRGVVTVPMLPLHGCHGGFAAATPSAAAPAGTVRFVTPAATLPQVSLVCAPAASRRPLGYRQCGPGQSCAVYD